MSELNGIITVETIKYRTCIVNGKKALFHRWHNEYSVMDPSPMIGGHPGGQISGTFGIIEYDDGTIGHALPSTIKFTDNLHKEFMFPDDVKSTKDLHRNPQARI